jgi:hypothetical protein
MRASAETDVRRALGCAVRRFATSLCLASLFFGASHAAQLTVTWVDNSNNEDGFELERRTGTAGVFNVLTSVAQGTTMYVDGAVTSGTTYCYRVRAYNTVGDSAYSNEACAMAPVTVMRTLAVTKAGTGNGTVVTSPSGINCGSACSATFTGGATLALTATAASGSTFSGWSGACTGTGSCAIVLDADKSVTATFAVSTSPTYVLAVTKSGAGAGTVTSTPNGISCGSACSASFAGGASVTLTAAAASGSTFTGWGGACSGTGTCTVTMSQARSVTAAFVSQALTLTSFTADKTGAQPAGTATTFTATASGGAAPYQYRWWVWNGTVWTLLQDWTSTNTHTWTPTTAGSYTFHVWARSNGTSGDPPEAYGYLPVTVTGTSQSLTLTSFTANRTGTRPIGRPTTFTATTSGGTAPYQYRWWVWDGTAWTLLRDWTTTNTHTWTPMTAGSYTFHVWARSNGTSGDPPEAYGYLPVTVR